MTTVTLNVVCARIYYEEFGGKTFEDRRRDSTFCPFLTIPILHFGLSQSLNLFFFTIIFLEIQRDLFTFPNSPDPDHVASNYLQTVCLGYQRSAIFATICSSILHNIIVRVQVYNVRFIRMSILCTFFVSSLHRY